MIDLREGDCRAILRELADNSIDSVVTDPPYDLTSKRPGGRSEATRGAVMKGFMGMQWDGSGIAFDPATWAEVLRVLKPGGHLLAFGGTRTYHRMACAIEDAGFEIRDQLGWVYGSGFPKSHNGDWGGTALKPAWEPICMARKALIGTIEANWLVWGTGALNVDGCRVPTDENLNGGAYAKNGAERTDDWGAHNGFRRNQGLEFVQPVGRWPANLVHDGSDEVVEAFPQAAGQLADASSSSSSTRKNQNVYGAMRRGRGDEPSANSENNGAVGFNMRPGARRLDGGSAARFFYCAKASKSDRGEGNNHPTVKPTALMQWLVRLVTPHGGVVLDPFMGSGSTGRACVLEARSFIGCEMNAPYLEIARARIAAAEAEVLW